MENGWKIGMKCVGAGVCLLMGAMYATMGIAAAAYYTLTQFWG